MDVDAPIHGPVASVTPGQATRHYAQLHAVKRFEPGEDRDDRYCATNLSKRSFLQASLPSIHAFASAQTRARGPRKVTCVQDGACKHGK